MNPPPNTAILFDLDGTLLDTAPDFARILNEMRAEEGLSPLPYPQIREVVSDGAAAMIQAGFALSPEDAGFEPLRHRLLQKYATGLAEQTRPFTGIEPLLQWLDDIGLPWGVVTNKPERYSAPLMRALGLDTRCAVLICPEHTQKRKPDPEPLLLACRTIDCLPQASIYIGDHRRDIEAGRRAGMTTVAAAFGYLRPGDSAQQWGSDYCATSAETLQPWLAARLEG
ncbi:HAD-IA family hydrolase [Motiliproteus sp. SC1-56]|uniref:HAD-IA family hydrolase n=1 Tax=Motiliproteus sp. SC1-56 TaxID=2799565 RepID=UPI001A8F83B9|nr:HAD-IA family hydrolase [Motiliproteus sp. SC1-56]